MNEQQEDLEAVRFVLQKPWSSLKRFAIAEVAFNRLEARVRTAKAIQLPAGEYNTAADVLNALARDGYTIFGVTEELAAQALQSDRRMNPTGE